MTAYKLLRLRKDGSLGSLFINKKDRLPYRIWMFFENHPTNGFAIRPGWHSMRRPHAPHLSSRGRVWAKVNISMFDTFKRPESQGGMWYLSKLIRIERLLTESEVRRINRS